MISARKISGKKTEIFGKIGEILGKLDHLRLAMNRFPKFVLSFHVHFKMQTL